MAGIVPSYFLVKLQVHPSLGVGLKARLAVVFQQDISDVFQQCISDLSISHDVCLLVIEIDFNMQLRNAR